MAFYFDRNYYLNAKVAQLRHEGYKADAEGTEYTAEILLKVLAEQGLSLRDHYLLFGRAEGLNPNPYFNESEYLAAKANQLFSLGIKNGAEYFTPRTLLAFMLASGMTPLEHYETYGAFERDSSGRFINPSNAFDANAYYLSKLMLMQRADHTATLDGLVEALQLGNMTPVTHYALFGAAEATAALSALVQTVPSGQRVINDTMREVVGDTTPSNYNPPTPAPGSMGRGVIKAADVGTLVGASVSPIVAHPAKNPLVPTDASYVAPPDGMSDSYKNPVIAPSTNDKSLAAGNWVVVDRESGSATVIGLDGLTVGYLPAGSVTENESGNLVFLPTLRPIPPSADQTLAAATFFESTDGGPCENSLKKATGDAGLDEADQNAHNDVQLTGVADSGGGLMDSFGPGWC